MKKLMVLAVLAALSACNTIEGAGKDVKAAGGAVEAGDGGVALALEALGGGHVEVSLGAEAGDGVGAGDGLGVGKGDGNIDGLGEGF